MAIFYTAREPFNSQYGDGMSWQAYLEWSKLCHLRELVSLDNMLCPLAFKADYESEEIYKFMPVDNGYGTDLFASMDFVLSHLKDKVVYNFLAVIKEPGEECRHVAIDGFEFQGYDLLDYDYEISALSNCGGFDETFLPDDLNQVGLITDYSKAAGIRRRLKENNPDEHHAECNLFALWRHRTLGKY